MIFQTTSQAYRGMLELILNKYDFKSSPRGNETLEKLNVQITVRNPSSEPVKTSDEDRNKVIASYTQKELDWYKSANTMADSAPAKFWKTLADKEGRINSNYGHLIYHDESEGSCLEMETDNLLNSVTTPYLRTPFEWCLLSLVNDKDSRQAIMRINKSRHAYVGNKDFPCTLYLNFHIRNNQLRTTVRMRSNDLVFGFPYDIAYFAKVAEDMVESYNELVDDKISIGPLTFSADSLHLYEKDMTKALKMLGETI